MKLHSSLFLLPITTFKAFGLQHNFSEKHLSSHCHINPDLFLEPRSYNSNCFLYRNILWLWRLSSFRKAKCQLTVNAKALSLQKALH